MSATQTKSFGHGADAALNELYSSVGATSTDEKMGTLRLQLGGMPNFYAMGGAINEEMKLACLEYEYLQQVGKIDLVLA